MSKDSLRIAVGGERRLRKAVEAQIRQAHQNELSRASDGAQRASIEEQIQREIQQEMKRVASPYSLWSSREFGRLTRSDEKAETYDGCHNVGGDANVHATRMGIHNTH